MGHITLFGATGFTGKLVARYLRSHPEAARFSWVVAGRNPDRLRALVEELASVDTARGVGAPLPEIVVADTGHPASIEAMVRQTQVVLTTAGPYSQHGGDVVAGLCAQAGTHYADLSGEYWFQRELIDAHHDTARSTGAKVIVAAGIDSIPSDLGAQLAIEALGPGARVRRIKTLYTDYAGGVSGGTLASGRAQAAVVASRRYPAAFHRDPYVLAPGVLDTERSDETVRGWDRVRFDPDLQDLGTPFFMAPVNARIVRRSLALAGHLPCAYQEAISVGAWTRALKLLLGKGFGYFVGDPIPMRPQPGEGPPDWVLHGGRFRAVVFAASDDPDRTATVEIAGEGDPGYLATSKMFAETGLCLALDDPPGGGGVLTPALALGATLRERLARAEGGRFMRFGRLT